MKPIVIFGVCHTAATINDTLNELKKFNFDKNKLVFIEPRKGIIKGTEVCDDPNIMAFFKKVLKYLFEHDVGVVPLNPSFMPSHSNMFLYRKIAQQFAEEECMVDIITSKKTDKQKIVIIGDVHAPRIRDLLKAKGMTVMYKSLSQATPSDIVLISWREALLGKARKFISMQWLIKFRDDLRNKLTLQKETRIPAIFYGNKDMYHEYLKQAKEMLVEGREGTKGYLVDLDKRFLREVKDLKKSTVKEIKKYDKEKEHEVLHTEAMR
ncbi:hypothetical protein ACFLZ6_01080 [Nanoarchaeota archaeon]